MVDKMALEQVLLQVLWFYPVIDHSTSAPYLYIFEILISTLNKPYNKKNG
jgi:hypothetical protein